MPVFAPYSQFWAGKIDYMEQKRACDIVFSNHSDNEKGAQQVGLGYHEVFGLVQWPKKIVTKKTAQNSPKLTIWGKKGHISLFFQIILIAKKVRSRWV